MQWDCNECHKPHDSAQPVVDCLTCHTEARTAGLHAVPAHVAGTGEGSVACAACHTPHEWTIQSRDTCATCHAAKVKVHFPGKLCTQCHDFGEISMDPAAAPPQGR
jgi:hypothetical protein